MAAKKKPRPVIHLLIFAEKGLCLSTPCNKRQNWPVRLLIVPDNEQEAITTSIMTSESGKACSFDMRFVTCGNCLRRIGSKANWFIDYSNKQAKKTSKSKLKKLAEVVNSSPSLI